MRFTYLVEVDVNRVEGKFASRDEIGDQLLAMIEGANEGEVTADEGGIYSVDDWSVEEQPQPKPKRKPKVKIVVPSLPPLTGRALGDG